MRPIRWAATAGSLAAAALLIPSTAAGQVTVGSGGAVSVGAMSGSGATGSSSTLRSSRPDRWGVPRLRSLRGDHRPERGRTTVPINVSSLANGTANDPLPPETRPRPRRRFFSGVGSSTIVHVHNQITVVGAGAAEAPRTRAVRNVDAARRRAAAAAADERETPSPSADVSAAPLVRPLVTPPSDEELDAGNCATVRITTPGGIEWRHRVALDALDASSVSGAASRLQETLRRGEPLVLRTSGGGLTVPAAQVESLVVGPCR